MTRQIDRIPERERSRMDVGGDATRRRADDRLRDTLALLDGHEEHLARRSAGIQAVHVRGDQEFGEGLHSPVIDLVGVVEGRYHGGDDAVQFFHVRSTVQDRGTRARGSASRGVGMRLEVEPAPTVERVNYTMVWYAVN